MERLAAGTPFTWSQAGVALASEVTEFVPQRRIAWRATSPWISAYHAWDIAPSDRGCSVVTDETQRGILPSLFGPIVKPQMLRLHARWLQCLELQAGKPGCASISSQADDR